MKLSLRVFAPVWIALGFFGAELSMAASGAESPTIFMGAAEQDAFTVQTGQESSGILREQQKASFKTIRLLSNPDGNCPTSCRTDRNSK